MRRYGLDRADVLRIGHLQGCQLVLFAVLVEGKDSVLDKYVPLGSHVPS